MKNGDGKRYIRKREKQRVWQRKIEEEREKVINKEMK